VFIDLTFIERHVRSAAEAAGRIMLTSVPPNRKIEVVTVAQRRRLGSHVMQSFVPRIGWSRKGHLATFLEACMIASSMRPAITGGI
jgi:hypothetical protein